jgi:gliding motility-associated-like protein
MKYTATILLFLIVFIYSCKEKDAIYPRPKETINIKVDHDTTINLFENQTFVLDATTGNSGSSYSWVLNSWYSQISYQYSSSIAINYPGYFQVDILTDTIHEIYTVYLNYSEALIYYPNSFTPDGDGINDIWTPTEGNAIDSDGYSLKIYDKKDHLLYKTDQYNSFSGWNGDTDGVPCPVGFYYYVVKYKTLSGEKHKDSGMLELIR